MASRHRRPTAKEILLREKKSLPRVTGRHRAVAADDTPTAGIPRHVLEEVWDDDDQ